jgi:hypothetical protein
MQLFGEDFVSTMWTKLGSSGATNLAATAVGHLYRERFPQGVPWARVLGQPVWEGRRGDISDHSAE